MKETQEIQSDASGDAVGLPPTAMMEVFFLNAHALLVEDGPHHASRAQARSRLAQLGLDEGRLRDLPLGLFVSSAVMRAGLAMAGFSPKEIHESRLLADGRLPNRVVGPIVRPGGRIVSFWAWDPSGSSPSYLYLNRQWKRHVPLFGLEVALPALADPSDELVLVEDPLDAVFLHSRGLLNVAAIAGRASELGPRYWEHLAASGIRRAVLAIRHDPGDRQPAAAAIQSARRARLAPAVRLLAGSAYAPYENPTDFARGCGIEAFREILFGSALFESLDHCWEPHYGQPPDARPTPPPEKVEPMPEDSAADAAVEPLPAERAAAPEEPRTSRPSGEANGSCRMHRCHELDCFCFD